MIDIAKHIGVNFKDLTDYDVNSIVLGKAEKYNKKFSYGLIDSKYIISNDTLISDFEKNENGEIKGEVAFKGMARGIAKIITHPDEISKINEGDVLVAQMTFPSFIQHYKNQ